MHRLHFEAAPLDEAMDWVARHREANRWALPLPKLAISGPISTNMAAPMVSMSGNRHRAVA